MSTQSSLDNPSSNHQPVKKAISSNQPSNQHLSETFKRWLIIFLSLLLALASFLPMLLQQAKLDTLKSKPAQQSIQDLEREFYALDTKTSQWLKIIKENPRAIMPLNFFEDLEKRNQLAAKLSLARAEVAEKVAEEEKEKEGLREIVTYLRESTTINTATEVYFGAVNDNLKQQEDFYNDWLEKTKDAQAIALTLDNAKLPFNDEQVKKVENLRKEAATRKREITAQVQDVKDWQNKIKVAQNGLSSAFKAYDIYYNIQKDEFLDGAGNAVDIGSKLAEIMYDEKQLKQISKRIELGQGTLSTIKNLTSGSYLAGALSAVKSINGFIKDYKSKEIRDTKNTLKLFMETSFQTPELQKVSNNLIGELAEKNNSLQKIESAKKTFETAEKVLGHLQTAWSAIKGLNGYISDYRDLLNSSSTRTTTTANLISSMSVVGDSINAVVKYMPPIMSETVGQFFSFYADALKAGQSIDENMRKLLTERGQGLGLDLIGGLQHSVAGRYLAENHTGLVEVAKEFENSGLKIFHIENTEIYYFIPDTNQVPIKLEAQLYRNLATVCSNFSAYQTLMADVAKEKPYLLTNDDLTGIIDALKKKTGKFQVNDGWFTDSTYELDGTKIIVRVNKKAIDIADALIHIKAAMGEQVTKSNLEKLLSNWIEFTEDLAFQEKLCGCALLENDKQKHNMFIAFCENKKKYERVMLREKLTNPKCLQRGEVKIEGDTKGELNNTVNLTAKLNPPLEGLEGVRLVWFNDTEKRQIGEGFSISLPLEKEGSHNIRVEFYSNSTGKNNKLMDSPIHTVTVGAEKPTQTEAKLKIEGQEMLKLGQTGSFNAVLQGTINQKPVYNYSLRYAWSHSSSPQSYITFEAKEPGLITIKCEAFAIINGKEKKVAEAEHKLTIPTRLVVSAPKEVNATDIFDVKVEVSKELTGQVKSCYWNGGYVLSDKPYGQEGTQIKMQYDNGLLKKDPKTNEAIPTVAKIGVRLYGDKDILIDEGFTEILVKPVYFKGSASEIWEGNTGAGGVGLKRKPMKNGPRVQYSAEGDRSYVSTASVWGEVSAYWTDRVTFKNTEEIAKKLQEGADKDKQLVPFSLGDFKGYVLAQKLTFSPGHGGWMTGYVSCGTYAGASGYVMKGRVYIAVRYLGAGAGSYDNQDRPWLEPYTESIASEAKGILTGITIAPDPNFTKTAYTGPKLDGSDFAIKLEVKLNASNKVYRPGQQPLSINAEVIGGKPPYNYQWTGQHAGSGNKVDFVSSKPGTEKLTVVVTSSDNQTATAFLEIKVEKLDVKITGLDGQLIYGTKRRLNISPSGYRVYWQSSQNLTFNPVESPDGSGEVLFDRIGEVKIWAQVLDKQGNTIGEATQQVVKVVAPKFQVTFDPPSGAKIGQEIKVTIKTVPEIDERLISYVWNSPISSNRMEYTNNSNQIGFKLRDTKPFELVATAQTPILADEIAQVKASYTATAYLVKADVVGATYSGPAPMVWDPNRGGLVPAPRGTYVTDQMVTVKATIEGEPQPNGVRFEWTVNGGTTISNNISQTPTLSRHEAGTAEAIVVARNNEGIFLGTSSTSFPVMQSGEKAAPLQVSLSATQPKLKAGETTQVRATVKYGSPPYSYRWAGAVVGSGEVVNVIGREAGKLAISVTVTDSKNKTATQNIEIEITGISQAQVQANNLRAEGQVLEQAGKLRQAINKYEESLTYWPDNSLAAHVKDLKAQVEEKQKNRERVQLASDLRSQGEALERSGNLKGAIDKYQQSLSYVPDPALVAHVKELQDRLRQTNDDNKGNKGETGTIDLSGTRWDWFDPNADASYNISGNTIIIRAPNGNDLWPAYNFDAPRLTKQVTGDFNLQVRVNSQWVNDYNGAGLVVNVSKTSVLRFERGWQPTKDGHVIVMFGFIDGKVTGEKRLAFSATDLYLKLERRGNDFTGYASTNGQQWQKVGMLTLNFPNTVSTGLALVNQHNNKMFQASFSDFHLAKVTAGTDDTGNNTGKNDNTGNNQPTTDRITVGKTTAGSSYAANCKGDVFSGGTWCNARNGSDWLQRDLDGLYEITEVRIGTAGTDVTTKDSRIVLKLQLNDGQWVVIDELKETNINMKQLSFGGIGNSIPTYRKTLAKPTVAKAFRLELYGNGWFGASDITLVGKRIGTTPIDQTPTLQLTSGTYVVATPGSSFEMTITITGNRFSGKEPSGYLIFDGKITGNQISFTRDCVGFVGRPAGLPDNFQYYKGVLKGDRIVGTFTGVGCAGGAYDWQMGLKPKAR